MKASIITWFVLMLLMLPANAELSFESRSNRIVYVDSLAPAGGDGTSWARAYQNLQDALADIGSQKGSIEIHLAAGTYRPDRGSGRTLGDRQARFAMHGSLTLKGGYAGLAGLDPNTRDLQTYRTVLSGDLAGDDGSIEGYRAVVADEDSKVHADNSLCVVEIDGADSSIILDGLVIVGSEFSQGVVDRGCGSDAIVGGGGIWIDGARLVAVDCVFIMNSPAVYNTGGGHVSFKNCTFVDNWAGEGGAVANIESQIEFHACLFEANTAWQGGAIVNRHGRVWLDGSCLRGNRARSRGGAVYSSYGGLTITRCHFDGNASGDTLQMGQGGAVFISTADDIVIKDSWFTGNLSGFGGAISVEGTDQFNLVKCLFHSNMAMPDGLGGGICALGIPSIGVVDCQFIANRAGRGGGIWAPRTARLVMDRCIFAGNRVAFSGSCVGSSPTNELQVLNCTIADNVADQGVSIDCPGPMNVRNSIIWDKVAFSPWANVDTAFCCSRSNLPGLGNIGIEPLFAKPGYWDPNGTPDDPYDDIWVDGDYHLKSQAGRWDPASQTWVKDDVTSPCIDAGDPNSPIGLEPFPNGGRINMGAYGGTAEASKSYFGGPTCETIVSGDIDGDCKVDLQDLAILASHWLEGW